MKKLTLGVLSLLFVFSACKKEEDDDDDTCAGTMTINWNGASVAPEDGFNNTLINEGAATDPQGGRRMDIRTNVNGKVFILTIANVNFQNPPENGVLLKRYGTSFSDPETVCQDFSGFTVCDGALATYAFGTSSPYVSDDEIQGGHITITANNTANRTVSGNYDVKMVNFYDDTDTIHATGTFTNQCY